MCEYQDRSGKSQCRARTNETEDRCEYDRNEQRPEILRPYASNFLYNAAGEFRKEYGGAQSADDGGVKYTHQDVQGSTRTISTQAGFAQARMDYQAFGEQISSSIGQRTSKGYTATDSLRNRYALTERDDATGLDVIWFRKLENRGDRWTSPDPYNGSANIGNGQSWNRYSYVENQPTNYVDPSGLFMIGPRPPGPREQSWLEICWLLGICGNPTSQGGEEVTVGGGSVLIDWPKPTPNQCDAIRELLKREKEHGTWKASRMSSIEFGGDTRLTYLQNEISGVVHTNTGPLDIDWLLTINAVDPSAGMGSSPSPAMLTTMGTSVLTYAGAKSVWSTIKKARGETIQNPLPFQEQGEINAVLYAGRRFKYASIFSEKWLKENCNYTKEAARPAS